MTSERKTKTESLKEFVQDNEVLDLLFSFIGVSSNQENVDQVQKDNLNLHQNYVSVPSRYTAGTTDFMHGINSNFRADSQRQLQGNKPQLLPVTCGYFFNIVRQLLAKARKQTMRYLLLDCEGIIFDRLVENVGHHSLSDLLVEMM